MSQMDNCHKEANAMSQLADFQFEEGDRVPGTPYELIAKVGQGAFGQVWKARHPTTGEEYALKFCLNRDKIYTFRNEAKHAHRIKKAGAVEGFVTLKEIFDEPERDVPFVAYEFVEGEDFQKLLRRRFNEQGPFPPLAAAEIIYELSMILSRIHTLTDPIVHRDIKPSNILVVKAESPWRFKVVDFGFGVLAITSTRAEMLSRTDEGRDSRGAGTLTHMSWEQCNPAHIGHPSDDVHALGVIWFELLAGSLSIFGATPPSHNVTLIGLAYERN
jgi:serine/threonine protein kinase